MMVRVFYRHPRYNMRLRMFYLFLSVYSLDGMFCKSIASQKNPFQEDLFSGSQTDRGYYQKENNLIKDNPFYDDNHIKPHLVYAQKYNSDDHLHQNFNHPSHQKNQNDFNRDQNGHQSFGPQRNNSQKSLQSNHQNNSNHSYHSNVSGNMLSTVSQFNNEIDKLAQQADQLRENLCSLRINFGQNGTNNQQKTPVKLFHMNNQSIQYNTPPQNVLKSSQDSVQSVQQIVSQQNNSHVSQVHSHRSSSSSARKQIFDPLPQQILCQKDQARTEQYTKTYQKQPDDGYQKILLEMQENNKRILAQQNQKNHNNSFDQQILNLEQNLSQLIQKTWEKIQQLPVDVQTQYWDALKKIDDNLNEDPSVRIETNHSFTQEKNFYELYNKIKKVEAIACQVNALFYKLSQSSQQKYRQNKQNSIQSENNQSKTKSSVNREQYLQLMQEKLQRTEQSFLEPRNTFENTLNFSNISCKTVQSQPEIVETGNLLWPQTKVEHTQTIPQHHGNMSISGNGVTESQKLIYKTARQLVPQDDLKTFFQRQMTQMTWDLGVEKMKSFLLFSLEEQAISLEPSISQKASLAELQSLLYQNLSISDIRDSFVIEDDLKNQGIKNYSAISATQMQYLIDKLMNLFQKKNQIQDNVQNRFYDDLI